MNPSTNATIKHKDTIRSRYGKVAVIYGGNSAEREISLISGQGVLEALLANGVDAHPFDPQTQPLENLKQQQFDRAFLILHGPQGEDGTVQGALTCLGIPYTGCGVMASAIGMDKLRTKLIWRALGLPTPNFELLDAHSDFAAVEKKLGLPLFVKPVSQGSSFGVVKVKQAGMLKAAYEEARQYDKLVLAESAIEGGEYTAPIFANRDEQSGDLHYTVLPIVKIEPATEFYDYQAKYLRDDTQYRCPCGLPPAQEAEIAELVERAFWAIGGESWGRIDFLMDNAGNPYLLEINSAPGMTSHSLFPMSAKVAGVSYENLVLKVLDTTLNPAITPPALIHTEGAHVG